MKKVEHIQNSYLTKPSENAKFAKAEFKKEPLPEKEAQEESKDEADASAD